jgi:serine/threonine protein kinase
MLQAAQRVGDFEIIRPLGRGGMGEVYEAQQFNPPRRVALKVLAPWLAQDETSLQRFRREVEVLANLDHPGIVPVIATGRTDDGIAFYAMKLIRGVALSELIRMTVQHRVTDMLAPTVSQVERPVDTPSGARTTDHASPTPAGTAPATAIEEYRKNRFHFVARIGAAAARALAAAHQQGHLHRDIKPSNLMFDHHDQLYLVDFGLTRALDAGANVSCTGGIRGTPWYMSPEQARGELVDQRTDIYSLGVSLYELATVGTGPFTASRDDSESVLEHVRSGLHLPLRALAPEIPWELERVILRAIQPKPRRRYQRAEELAADLERLAPSHSGLGPPAVPPVRHQWRLSKTWWAAASLITVGVLAAIILSWRFVRRPRPAETDRPAVQVSTNTGRDEQGSSTADPPAPPTHGRDRYPDMLRNPPERTAVPLLKGDFAPVWSNPRLMGTGTYNALPTELIVTSATDAQASLFGLADSTLGDPRRLWFEFAIDVRQQVGGSVDACQAGVFWGYRRESGDGGSRVCFFVAGIDERAVLKDAHGRVTIGSSLVETGDGNKGAVSAWLRPLPQGRSIVPLREPSAEANRWHRIRVRVVDYETHITVDEGPSREFAMEWLLGADPWLQNLGLDPRGTMGVWVRNGTGSFRNATMMALPGGMQR